MRHLPQTLTALWLALASAAAGADDDGLDMEVDSFGLTLELPIGGRAPSTTHWLDRVQPAFMFGMRLGRVDPETGTLLRCEDRCDRWPEEARSVKLSPAAIAEALDDLVEDERWRGPLSLPRADPPEADIVRGDP